MHFDASAISSLATIFPTIKPSFKEIFQEQNCKNFDKGGYSLLAHLKDVMGIGGCTYWSFMPTTVGSRCHGKPQTI